MSEKLKQHFAYIDKTDGMLVCIKNSYSSDFSFETPGFRTVVIDGPTEAKISTGTPWTYSAAQGFTSCAANPSKELRFGLFKKQIELMQLLKVNHDLVSASIDQRLNADFVNLICKQENIHSQILSFVEEERQLVKEINTKFLTSQLEKVGQSKSLAELEHIAHSLRADFELGLYARRVEK